VHSRYRSAPSFAREREKNVVGSGDFEFPGRLNIDVSGDPVFNDDGKALAAHSHSELGAVQFQSQGFDVGTIAVGEHQDFIAHTAMLTPGIHDEHIVHRRTRYGVNSLCLYLIGQFHESRQMFGVAGGRERTWHGEQHHGLTGE